MKYVREILVELTERYTDHSQIERLRLQAQHELVKLILKDRKIPLFPDTVSKPDDVLDCGFGTGAWSLEVATLLPDCHVGRCPCC